MPIHTLQHQCWQVTTVSIRSYHTLAHTCSFPNPSFGIKDHLYPFLFQAVFFSTPFQESQNASSFQAVSWQYIFSRVPPDQSILQYPHVSPIFDIFNGAWEQWGEGNVTQASSTLEVEMHLHSLCATFTVREIFSAPSSVWILLPSHHPSSYSSVSATTTINFYPTGHSTYLIFLA